MHNVYPIWTFMCIKIPLHLTGKEKMFRAFSSVLKHASMRFFFFGACVHVNTFLSVIHTEITYPVRIIHDQYRYSPATLLSRHTAGEILSQPAKRFTWFHCATSHLFEKQNLWSRDLDTHLSPNIMDSCRHCVHASWNHCSQRKHCSIFRYHLRRDGKKR